MFERFTEQARQVVVFAQDESRALRHAYIDTEHLLLGVLREEEGLGARTLLSLGITIDAVREVVTRIVGRGDDVATGQIPFTPRAKAVLEFSLQEALALGHPHIGTEHILLGLVRESGNRAVGVLDELGADSDSIRASIVQALSVAPSEAPREIRVGGFAPAFGLADLAAAVEDAKRLLLQRQEFEDAARLRNQQRRLHGVIREIETELARLAARLQLDDRADDVDRWEYDVKIFVGVADTWPDQLATWRRDGWELLTVVQDGDIRRAIVERRI